MVQGALNDWHTTTNNGAFLTVDAGGGDGNVALRDNSIENHKHDADSSIAISTTLRKWNDSVSRSRHLQR